MRRLVLDSEAVSLLARSEPGSAAVIAAVKAAIKVGHEVTVPTVVLAELFRGASRRAAVNSLLSRERHAIMLRDTDPGFANLVGGVLHSAGADSADMVDAHCVAAAIESGGGLVMSSDVRDIERLSAPYANIHTSSIKA